MTTIHKDKIPAIISAARLARSGSYTAREELVALVQISHPCGFVFLTGSRRLRKLLRMPKGNPVPVRRLEECIAAWAEEKERRPLRRHET